MRKGNITYLKKRIFDSFTRQYSLSKTLRFELKPVPETKKFLPTFIDLDAQRHKDYQELKGIIDEYHKDYIERSLTGDSILSLKDMRKLNKLYHEQKKIKSYEEKERIKKEIGGLQDILRKQIVRNFKDQKQIFGKDLLVKVLPQWLEDSSLEEKEHKQKIVENFKKFSTYLTGFHENRKNIYSDKEQSTAVSHRIVNENFPKFSANEKVYDKIKQKFPDVFKKFNNLKSSFQEEFQYFGIENIEQVFTINFFNKCLNQKGIDNYNTIIGGKTLKRRQKIQGLNEIVNIYRQNIPPSDRRNLPAFQFLYKQILSDRDSHSFLMKPFEDNKSLMNAIDDFWIKISEPRTWDNSEQKTDLLSALKNLFSDMSEKHLDQIYFKGGQLSHLSQQMFGSRHFIQNALEHYIKTIVEDSKTFSQKEIKTGRSGKVKKGKTSKSLENEKNNFLKKDFFSFKEIHNALLNYREALDAEEIKEKIKTEKNNLLIYFQSVFSGKKLLKAEGEDRKSFITYFQSALKERKMPDIEKLRKFYSLFLKKEEFSKDDIESIKVFLDSIQSFLQLIRPVYLEEDRRKVEDLNKDSSFYGLFDELYQELSPVINLYNKCRNFIAANRKDLKKIKINFEDSTLLNGWDVNKESDNLSVILRKKENGKWYYYLGVMNKENRKLFDYQLNFDDYKKEKAIGIKNKLRMKILADENCEEYYEKMNYKFLPGPNKMLPRVCFSEKNISYFNPSQEIKKIRDTKTFSKNDGDKFSLKDCHKLIDFYKASIGKHYDWKNFGFKFSPTNQYKDISDFYYEVSSQGYKLSFDKIKTDYINEKIKSGELYLFKIYNKDFSEHSRGKPNLHTSYFRLLFETESLRDIVFKINGGAEVFYREASEKSPITHPKNKSIKNKNPLNPKESSTFTYDLIKDKRFTENKFFFHVPITLNFKERDIKPFKFNQEILKFLKDNKDVNIIGIDRGERHLAYYTIINQQGEILKQGSFNSVESSYKYKEQPVNMKTDYHKLLDKKEQDRDEARKSWTEIKNIKDLKVGYLSHLVHQISRLMVEYNAVVILEDLNFGFKRGRMKFEKQVYQKFEKALIDKLNYLVFKDIDNFKEPGGHLNAYQLTAPFESFKKLGKQTGFIFYVPAYYTSKICPLTGFVNLIYPKYESLKKSMDFFNKFEKIYFNPEKDYFVFEYKDGKVNPSRRSESDTLWRVCTQGQDRYEYDRADKRHKKVDVTQKMKELFDRFHIDYKNSENLIEQIVQQEQKDFFIGLIHLLRLTLQLRHVNPEASDDKGKDFILSSVSDERERFFDSREAEKNEPQNTDANGAYHIALKGLKTLQTISQPSGNSKGWKVHPVKNKDWFDFVRNKTNNQKRKAG